MFVMSEKNTNKHNINDKISLFILIVDYKHCLLKIIAQLLNNFYKWHPATTTTTKNPIGIIYLKYFYYLQ